MSTTGGAPPAIPGFPLSVAGGAGSTTVDVAELAELGRVLEQARGALLGAAAGASGAAGRLEGGVALAPQAGARALAALDRAHGSALRLAAGVGALAGAVAQARACYGGVEGSVVRRLAAVVVPRGPLDLLPGSRLLPDALLPAALDVGRPHQALLGLGWVLGALPPSSPAVALGVVGERETPAEAPAGVGDLLGGIHALYPASGGEPGAIEIRRIERPTGATSWVVLVPGTQSFWPGGRNPMDTATNVQALVGAPSAMATAVVAALTAAGARRDEPILLAGHSQGGIIATRLAADPAFRRRYRVTSVLTAGSPVGHVPTPRGVAVLHVEHAGDAVPLLDHARNPGTADRLTVTRRRGTGPDAASHDAAAYARTGALIDSSRHPSVRAWRRQARAVLASPGTTATRTVYRVERPG